MSILEYQSIDTEFDRISNSDKNEPEAIEKIKLTIKTIINDKTLSNDFKATFIGYVKKLVISKNKNPREVWKLIHNSKKFKEVVKKYGIVQVYRLKNLKKRSNGFYGKLGKSHEEQDKDILKNDSYWEFYNLRNLLVLADGVKKNGKEKNERLGGGFSASGSFGSIYLGYLLKKEKEINSGDLNQSFPLDIMIGSSSGGLYPVWYSLWREAAKINPEKVKFSIEGMMEYFPKNLDGKNLLINGEYIMNSFIISSQKLIKIINETRKSDPLPNIKNITFNDLKRNIGIIASRNRKDGSFQQILFSNGDNVLKAIMASTNPKFFLLGNLLTDVNFANNNWNDGWHTNPNPWENLGFFSPSKIFQIVGWPGMEEKISPNIEVENCNYIPKMVEKKSYTQGEDFDIETTYLRAIIGYFGKINVSNTINMINYLSESNFLSKEQKKSAIKKLISYLKSALKPGEIKENTNEAVFGKISFDTTTQDLSIIQENKYLSKNDKTEIIKAYFNPFFDFIIKYNGKDFNEKSEELKRKLPIKDSLLKDNLLSLTLYYYSISNFNQLFKENKSKLKKWLIKNDFEIPNSLKPYIDLTQYSTYKRYILGYNIPSKYITKISSLNDINSKLKDLNQIVHSYGIINPEEIDYSYYEKKIHISEKELSKSEKILFEDKLNVFNLSIDERIKLNLKAILNNNVVIFKEIGKEKLKQIIALSPVKIINKLRQYGDDELRVILSDIDIILMVFNDNDSNSLGNITKDYFMKISEEIIGEYKNNVKKPLKQVIKKYINKKRFFREEFNIKKQIEIIIKLFGSEKHEMLELIKNIYSKTYSPKIKETIYEFLKGKFITEEIEYMTTNIDNELINKKFSLDDINNILLKSGVKIIEIVGEFSNYNDFFTKKREPGKNLALSLIYNKIKKEPIYMYIKWEKIEEALYNYLKNDSSSEICSIVILPILEELKSKKEKKQYLNNRFVPK